MQAFNPPLTPQQIEHNEALQQAARFLDRYGHLDPLTMQAILIRRPSPKLRRLTPNRTIKPE